jgi:ATP-binding cassette subfamily C protein
MILLPVSTPREAARLARALLLRRPAALAACLLMFAVEGLAGLVAPWMLGRIVDVVDGGGSRDELLVPVLWIVGAAIVGGVATALSIGLLARVAEPALADLREQVLDRAVHLDSARLEAAGSGDLVSRVGDDVRIVAGSITDVVPLMLNSAIAVVFTAAGLFALDWRLGVAGLGAVPFYVLSLRWYLPRSAPYYRRERAANGERAEALLTGVHASRTLRAYGLADQHQTRVDDASWKSTQISIDVFRLLTRFFGRNNRAELIGLLLIMVTGFALVRSDEASVGAVTAAALFFHRLFNPIGALVTLFDDVQSAGASLTRLAGLALLPPPQRPGDPTRPRDAGVEVRALHHEYVAGHAALDSIDLHLRPGERLAVVGASGAGKSTLGLAVAGRLRPSSGTVLLGGGDLDDLDVGDRPPVALVTQEVHVFSGTIRDNLTLAAPSSDDSRLEAALRDVGAWASVHALPDGLDTVVGDNALTLTPALAQQLALARVILADPLVAVLDEATAEAGSAGARDLERAAAAVTEGRTSLTIAHRLSQARDADRILVMDSGRIVESGTHDELVALGGTYSRLWAAWTGHSGLDERRLMSPS